MKIRRYKLEDTLKLIELFRNTVHTVCKDDYSQEQLNAWAPSNIDEGKWMSRLSLSYTLIVEEDGEILGFSNLENNGRIDMFYVAASAQAKGVGRILFTEIEAEAKRKDLQALSSDVSLTARKFFLSRGFTIEREYQKFVGEVAFPNAIMIKRLIV